jgi:hypothetical protein
MSALQHDICSCVFVASHVSEDECRTGLKGMVAGYDSPDVPVQAVTGPRLHAFENEKREVTLKGDAHGAEQRHSKSAFV